MAIRYYANAPATTLADGCTAAATTILVSSVTGLPVQYPYTLILDRGQSTEEVVEVTAASGNSLTVVRGADSTTAFSHAVGASVEHGISARDVREANEHINDATGVHGLGSTSSVVGTTDTQTLTGKTISADDNTINGFPVNSFIRSDANGKADGAAAAKAVPTGDVVGTTDTQTLTNKTLTSPTLTNATVDNLTVTGDITGTWQPYTPSWTAVTTNPTLGNGTMIGTYRITAGTVDFRILINFGSTTNGGSGSYRFTLPVPASVPIQSAWHSVGRATVQDPSGAPRQILDVLTVSSANILIADATGAQVSNTFPYAVGTGSKILISGSYEAA